MKSIKSFFRRTGRVVLRKFGRKNLIIAISVVGGAAVIAVAVIFVLKNGSAKSPVSSDLNISIENENPEPENETVDETVIETASSDTKVDSTEDTTILVLKENAQKGYLNRCVFLGDSRTVAMVNYGLINDDAALAQIGISHPAFKNNTFINNAGKSYTLKSYLQSHQAPVIYIALGVNGINDPSEEHYKSTYIDLIDNIMNLAPNSNIVLMSIGPVDDNGAYKNSVQNAWIEKYNDFLLQTAKDKHIFYLNTSEILTGENGQVKPEYNGGDGLHYNGDGCQAILDYIVDHPVSGIPDDGEYVVKYIKPNPQNTKVTMDDGSGIDAEKLQEIMNMMMESESPTPTPAQEGPSPEDIMRQEQEARGAREAEEQQEREEEERRAREAEENQSREEEKKPEPTPEPTETPAPEPEPTQAPTPEPEPTQAPEPEPTETPAEQTEEPAKTEESSQSESTPSETSE